MLHNVIILKCTHIEGRRGMVRGVKIYGQVRVREVRSEVRSVMWHRVY